MSLLQRTILPGVVCLIVANAVFAQGGGKAEPKRVEFAKGSSSSKLTGSLSNSQEMEYVFSAKKGQTVVIKMSNTGLFDYRVFNPEVEFETEFDSSPTSTFELPESGEYFLFIRKKMVSRPRTARFALTISIK
ncbi:MAG: hypothetical protein HOP17_06265 [Acidobacteria bacterium]|nr:hypothetical protein [Acidobacteriota bacterium]